jgi:glycine oxidase
MKQHAVIIGAGAVGCLSAIALAKRGWRVSLLDRGVVGAESSWAGGGILFPLLPWKYREPVNRLALAGAAQFPALCRELLETTGIDPEFQPCGMLVMPDYGGDSAIQWCQAHGLTTEIHDGSLWLQQVAQVRNPRLMQALRAYLEKLGAAIHEFTEMAPMRAESGKISAWNSVDGRKFEAEAYIVTAGAWSSNLLGIHAASLQVRPMRGQMLLYRLPEGTLPHMLYRDDFYLIPRRDGHILAGSTVEDVGFDKSTTLAASADLAAKACTLLPQLQAAPILKHWSGLRPGSPENLPAIARHPAFDNLYLNTGHFRYGVTMSPASAEILAKLVCGEAP